MDRPPPYNPAYEHASAPFAPTAAFSPGSCAGYLSYTPEIPDNCPAYQPPTNHRSASVRCRRDPPAPPPFPHSFTGHGGKPSATGTQSHSLNLSPVGGLTTDHGKKASSSTLQIENSLASSQDQSLSMAGLPPVPRRRSAGAQRLSSNRVSLCSDDLPKIPPRRVSSGLQRSSAGGMKYRCLSSSGLKAPTCIGISPSGAVLLVDVNSMTLGIYTQNGKKKFEFKAVGVQGGCFWMEQRLALATLRGITICDLEGKIIQEVIVGTVMNTKPYSPGFIAVQKQQLRIYSGSNCQLLKCISARKRPGILQRSHGFKSISDIAINSNKDITVLDVGSHALYIITDEGLVQLKIPLLDVVGITCGSVADVYNITTDRQNSIVLSDQKNKRILRISPDGPIVSCLIDFTTDERGLGSGTMFIHAVEMNFLSELYIVLSDLQASEIRIYSL